MFGQLLPWERSESDGIELLHSALLRKGTGSREPIPNHLRLMHSLTYKSDTEFVRIESL